MKRNYKRIELTVHWDSDKCEHCGNCLKLSSVFDLSKKLWINIQGASAEEIRRQVEQCPSGALTITPEIPCPLCHHPHLEYKNEPCVSCGCKDS